MGGSMWVLHLPLVALQCICCANTVPTRLVYAEARMGVNCRVGFATCIVCNQHSFDRYSVSIHAASRMIKQMLTTCVAP